MSIKVFKDSSANSIFIEDANGAQFLNSLQASVTVDKIVITDLAKQIKLFPMKTTRLLLMKMIIHIQELHKMFVMN